MKRRGKQTEYQAAIKKFLEESKEPLKRLKLLKHGLEKSSLDEVKKFYKDHASTIFYVVYGSFTQVEQTILERAARGKGYSETILRDLVDIILPSLERVLVVLPEMIHVKWQYNSICFIIKKLLHPENHKKLRQYGIKLLILWVQALQENANDACMELFASAIPHFPPRKTPEGLPLPNPSSSLPASLSPTSGSAPSGLSDRYGVYTSAKGGELSSYKYPSSMSLTTASASKEVVNKPQLPPLHPQTSTEPSDETMTLELMEYLLKCLTSQVDLLYWDDPSNYIRGFAYLFFSFKLFFLACLYKDFRSSSGLYAPSDPPEIKLPTPEVTRQQSLESVVEEDHSEDSLGDPSASECSTTPKKASPSLFKRRRVAEEFRLSSVIKLDYDLSDPVYPLVKDLILKYVLMWVLPSNSQQRGGGISGSPAPSPLLPRRPKFVPSGVELMRDMWFTSRDNVNMLLEICRLGFQTPLLQTYTLRKLVELYFHWEQTSKKPLFMQQPPVRSVGEVTSDLSTTTEEHTLTSTEQDPQAVLARDGSALPPQPQPSVVCWEELSGYPGYKRLDVEAGLQSSLRMFVLHTQQIFFRETRNYDELMCQVELCRKVIRLYQDIAVSWVMNKDTWEYMLAVILHLTLELLKDGPPDNRDSTLGGILANALLKSLLVCYLRASMVFNVAPQLWDNLLSVLSSLTHWKEVVIQWKQIMDSMTQVLAQTVYDLNLHDLPLERLELEDQHRLQQKTRLKSQDHMTTPNPRTSSFTTINVVSSHRRDITTYTPPMKHSRILEAGERSTSSVGDINSKRRRLTKSRTEDPKESPPMVPRSDVKRFSTPDHAPMIRMVQPRALLKVHAPTIEEEEGEGESPEAGAVPRRSSSSIGQISSRKLSDGGTQDEVLRVNLLEPRAISSPGATSLPPEMLFDAIPVSGESGEHAPLTGSGSNTTTAANGESISANEKELQMKVKDAESARLKDAGGEVEDEESVIINFHAKSTSPEPIPETVASDANLIKSTKDKTKSTAASSTLSKPEDGEGKDGSKGHSKGREGSKWTDLFHWRSQTVDRRRAKSMHGVKPAVAPGDLVLANKGFTKAPETKAGQKYKTKTLSRSDSDTSDLRSKAEAAKESKKSAKGFSIENISEEIGHSMIGTSLHRSLSDSNIPTLIRAEIAGASPSSSLNAKALDDSNLLSRSHLLLRRVVSSGPVPPREGSLEGSMHDKALDDEFTASIIPYAHDGMLAPQKMTSPARHLPLTRTKLMRSATVAEESIGETNKRVQPLAEDNEKEKVRKSPPLLVLSPTSPIQPAVLSPASSPQSMGWTPVVAAVIWCRMLRILGDINDIQDPFIHAEALGCLQEIWKALYNIAANSGIALGTQPTPPLPAFMPPLSLLLPWVVKACCMPEYFDSGRTKAYQLLCEMTIHHWHTPPTLLHLTHFYRLMHAGLQPASDMLSVAVRYGSKLFCHGLTRSSVLIRDCIQACSTILANRRNSDPRIEALHLLGAILFLPEFHSSVPIPDLSTALCENGGDKSVEEVGVSDMGVVKTKGVRGAKLREKVIDILFESARREPMRICRCSALYQVGMLAYSELKSGRPSNRLPEGIEILLASLQFADRTVAMSAIDMTCLLLEVSVPMKQLYPSLPSKVLEALCYAIAVFMKDEPDKVTWVDKIVVTLIHCLRDWLITLPIQRMVSEGSLSHSTLNSIFEVLQTAAGSSTKQSTVKIPVKSQSFTVRNPVSNVQLAQLDTVTTRSPRGHSARGSRNQLNLKRSGEDVQLSSERSNTQDEDRVQTAARSVLTHLLNQLGHFPFGCGAAQMGSVVTEFHDSPNLKHLDELSTEIFDSPRVQFFSFNNTAVVTLVEIPTNMDGVPGNIATASYQTRIIVRDVTGKYTWDCAVLYGPEIPPQANAFGSALNRFNSDLSQSESATLSAEVSDVTLTDVLNVSPGRSPLEPPSWRTHANTDRDVLEDLLLHVEMTSPECLLFPGQVGLCEPVPVGGGAGGGDSSKEVEETMVKYLTEQHFSEQRYIREAFILPSMKGEKASAPTHFPSPLPFHYCRVFLSHLGMFSWAKRSHLDLLEKNNQLILELKHLDSIQTQSRQTYKVAVLYVAPGQEDKMSILSNSYGSHQYEDFIAGIGWEVEMKSHRGYMGGLKREFCAGCSLPYYATSSEEVLFHVATRMPMKVDQIIRHLGNDEVHIVWSEHWRDYRRTIFKTQFADVLIIIYPLPTGLFRIQIQKKPNVPLFGPLFDGALVDRSCLSALVRATALNALRAQRSPLIGYRGRYEERMKYIRTLTDVKLQSSFENFAENVMHPLEMSSKQTFVSSSTLRSSPQKVPSSRTSMIAAPASIPSQLHTLGQSPNQSQDRLTASGLFKKALETLSTPPRQRANTNDERMLRAPIHNGANGSGMQRNQSMPDQLNETGLPPNRSNTGPSLSRHNNSLKQSPKTSKYNLSDSHIVNTVKKKMHLKPDT